MGKGNKNKVPEGWENFTPYGEKIFETPFVAFKVPLNQNLHGRYEQEYFKGAYDSKAADFQEWTLKTMLEKFPRLDLVIDLTNTDRYYDPQFLKSKNVKHFKIKTEGHVIPKTETVKRFFQIVDDQLHAKRDSLIGVHCTHGLNRTGYFICRYLIQRLDYEPPTAIEKFNYCRGHDMERRNYLDDLRRADWSEEVEDQVGVYGASANPKSLY